MNKTIAALRTFYLSVFSDYEVIQGQDNQVSMPDTDKFIVITPLSQTAPALGLAAEYVDGLFTGSIAAGVLTVTSTIKPFVLENGMNLWWAGQTSPVKVLNAVAMTTTPAITLASTTIAAGKKSISQIVIGKYQIDVYGNDAHLIIQDLRNYFNDDLMQEQFNVDDVYPLFCSESRQIPFHTGEKQILKRWSVDVTMQYLSTTDILSQQFFDNLEALYVASN